MVEFEFTLDHFGSSKEYKTIGDIFKEDLAKIGQNERPTNRVVPSIEKTNSKEFDAVTLHGYLVQTLTSVKSGTLSG